ncbi:MAG TPA: hypothetical protein VIM73_07900, partial [Polyangiaceae bacterium]
SLVHLRFSGMLQDVFAGPAPLLEARVKLLLLHRGLSLSDEQRERIRPILEDSAAKSREVRRQVEPELAPLREAEREAIRTLLRADQRREYDQRLAEVDAALGRRR